MTNIWSFLVQTAAVSMTAWFLWGIRTLVARQLPPRWQYGLWGILALRILLPVSLGRYYFLPFGLWIESLKIMVEHGLTSNYASPYAAEKLHHVLPWYSCMPQSITDWLFVLYGVGVLLSLLTAGVAYLRLRRTIERYGRPAEEALQAQVEAVGARYGLATCPVYSIKGTDSPFVCGLGRPMLVLPEGKPVDDKVLLHELLHLKYHDAAQNAVWRILRAFHWCNPMLLPIFAQVECDLEMACDQRVLERLEGEERRDYGRILLSMANEKYAHLPGTSSISNGGSNIRRRIGAIVYFKKFPKGMAVLSICLLLLLGAPALYGMAYTVDGQALEPGNAMETARAQALVRLRRCTTPDGAIDTYAKGILLRNEYYRMMASPLAAEEPPTGATEPMDRQFANLHIQDYSLCNYAGQSDGSYHALLLFDCQSIGQDSTYQYHTVLLPIRVFREDGWVVEPMAVPTTKENLGFFPEERLYEWGVEPMAVYRGEGETGSTEARIYTIHTMEQAPQNNLEFLEGTPFDTAPYPDGSFTRAKRYFITTYTTDARRDADFERTVGLQVAERMEADDEPYDFTASLSGEAGGASSDGVSWLNKMIRDDWDGTVTTGSSRRWYAHDKEDFILPHRYEACIYWDGRPVEEMTLTEVK